MGFWSSFGNIITGGLTGGLLRPFGKGDDKPKEDPFAKLMGQLQPLIDQQKEISGAAGKAGLADTASARNSYDYVDKYLRKLLEGSDDELLRLFDASGATRNSDENEQQLSELGVRGGRRAADLGQASFDRDASIDRVLKNLRFAAPGQIANIGQALANLGLGELSASTGAGALGSNIALQFENLKINDENADEDRRTALIGSIFQAIGSIAGGIAGGR